MALEHVNKTKLAIYAALTLLLLLAQDVFAQVLLLVTGAYAGYRAIILASHGFGCSTCQLKLAGAIIVFLTALVFSTPRIYYLVIVLLWLDILLKDENNTSPTTNFYG